MKAPSSIVSVLSSESSPARAEARAVDVSPRRRRSRSGALRRVAAGLVAAALGVVGTPLPAVAQGGEVGGEGNEYFLNDGFTGTANIHFFYGAASDRAYVGDWNGDGVDSLGVRRGAVYHLRNSLSGGPAQTTVVYGRADDVTYIGDWDGDGADTLAVRRGNVFFIKNTLAGGAADRVVVFGRPDDVFLVGDWDGDGDDSLAVRRGNAYHIKFDLGPGAADLVVLYGRPSDGVLVGDWDGDDDDALTVRRGRVYYVKNDLGSGAADRQVVFGRETDAALAGDWNADGTDTLGVRRLFRCEPFGTTADQVSGNPFSDISSGIWGSSMRVGRHPCFDRVVFEFGGEDEVPGWVAGYVDVIRNEETGEPLSPPFAGSAFIDVFYGAWSTGEPLDQAPFSGPNRLLPGFPALKEARNLGSFEAVGELGIGVDRRRPFRVTWLDDPVRLVIDVFSG